MSGGGVKVGVRVRPFNEREKNLNAVCCIQMVGDQTSIQNPETSEKKKFTFDYSFWSHDGFEENEEGYFVSTSSRYHDQQYVYDNMGKEVLDNAFQGYHCTLFAYGQTGSGKSYSMVGYKVNKGIVPMVADEIFKRVSAGEKGTEYQVTVSMLEIYNEKIQDLLIHPSKRSQGGLKARESKTLGVYVEGLTDHPVSSYRQIDDKMEQGFASRTLGATLMNATSSRAHTVIAINFKQITTGSDGQKTQKLSVINLVDLAGSEKAGQTGATGDRLKEGCAINKSLTNLGSVISVLADKAMGKGKGEVVPYRNSALTRILQNALGGNSKTIMICALSPASSNYEETLSTLRYADRAKKIVNKAKVNESATDKLIRELREENERLKGMVGKGGTVNMTGMSEEEKENYLAMQAEMERNKREMEEMESSWQKKLEDAMSKEAEVATSAKHDLTIPHITNLNEDPQLSGQIYFNFEGGTIRVGRKNGNPKPDLLLGDIAIMPNHGKFDKEGGGVLLKAEGSDAIDNIYINGKKIEEEGQTLLDKDRIIFGTNSVYIFTDPTMPTPKPEGAPEEIDYEYALLEKMKSSKEDQNARAEEIAKEKEEEMQRQIAEMKEKADQDMKKRELEFEARMKEMQDVTSKEQELARMEREKINAEVEVQKKIKEIEEEKKKAAEEAQEAEKKKVELEDDLSKYLPMVSEANMANDELQRKLRFELKIVKQLADKMVNTKDLVSKAQTALQIQVDNKEKGYKYLWDLGKFTDRMHLIRDMYQNYFETGVLPAITEDTDPFWDPPEPQLIGFAYPNLQSLGYLMDNKADFSIVAPGAGGGGGKLTVNIIPTDEEGKELDEDEYDFPDEPSDMVGKPMNFVVQIPKAMDLPKMQCTDCFCTYTFYVDDTRYETTHVMGKHTNPEFDYKKIHNVDIVTEHLLKYLNSGAICVKVYGYTDAVAKTAIAPPPPAKTEAKKEERPAVQRKSTKVVSAQPESSKVVIVEEKKTVVATKKKKSGCCNIF